MHAQILILITAALLLFPVLPGQAIPPQEAARHIGKSGAVNGPIAEINIIDGNVFINLGDKYPNQPFTAFVDASAVPTVGLDYLESLRNQHVSVAGTIVNHRGKPQIRITAKNQIIRIDPITTTAVAPPKRSSSTIEPDIGTGMHHQPSATPGKRTPVR